MGEFRCEHCGGKLTADGRGGKGCKTCGAYYRKWTCDLVDELDKARARIKELQALVRELWQMAGCPDRVTITTAEPSADISVSIGFATEGGEDA